ncbi:hypothetical protein TRAPUB_571 [Trametes pubescens]|uniref:Uncharacterized protein n=1 Tax=Trametes pubescens TaxID=154538 RepID=A0A1M2VLW8_TRAPU|nr:hypothetical protein TRAPUB_571 [Trametes pubescens]
MNSNRPTGSLAACIRRSPSVRERLLSPDRDDQGGRQSRLGQSYTPVATGAESNLGSIARGGSLDSEVLVEVPSMHTARAVRALPSFRRGSTENDLELVEVPSARILRNTEEGSNEGDRDVLEYSEAPTVVVPPGLRLTSTATFSDVRGGYERASEMPQSSPVMRGNERVLVPTHWIRLLDNPDSIAALLVSPGADGNHRPVTALTHQKLRVLFKVAVDWYLKEQGVVGREVHGTFVRVDHDSATEEYATPPRVTWMHVRGQGYDFYVPARATYIPTTSFIIVMFASVVGATLLVVAIYGALAANLDVVSTVTPTDPACPLRTFLQDVVDPVVETQHQLAVAFLRVLGRGVIYVDDLLGQVRRLAEV